MSVEYFTPSEEDIRIGLLWMNWYKMWNEFFNDYDDDIIDSSAAVTSEFALPSQPIPLTFNPKFGKDFTPVAVQYVLPEAQINPTYRVREVKDIGGKKFIFYYQELPKDK